MMTAKTLTAIDLLRAILLEAEAGDDGANSWRDEDCALCAAQRIQELATAAIEGRQPDPDALALQPPELIGQELYDQIH